MVKFLKEGKEKLHRVHLRGREDVVWRVVEEGREDFLSFVLPRPIEMSALTANTALRS